MAAVIITAVAALMFHAGRVAVERGDRYHVTSTPSPLSKSVEDSRSPTRNSASQLLQIIFPMITAALHAKLLLLLLLLTKSMTGV
jgi:hypothetical protein